MAYALLLCWRDGREEYLRDAATRHVETFGTMAHAKARRRDVRDAVEWELSHIDIVPAPRAAAPTTQAS